MRPSVGQNDTATEKVRGIRQHETDPLRCSPSPKRPAGTGNRRTAFPCCGRANCCSSSGVRTAPGTKALSRMPAPAHSGWTARRRTHRLTAIFDAWRTSSLAGPGRRTVCCLLPRRRRTASVPARPLWDRRRGRRRIDADDNKFRAVGGGKRRAPGVEEFDDAQMVDCGDPADPPSSTGGPGLLPALRRRDVLRHRRARAVPPRCVRSALTGLRPRRRCGCRRR